MSRAMENRVVGVEGILARLNAVPAPVAAVNRDCEVIFINEAGARALGRSAESCLWRKCSSLFRSNLCGSAECPARRAMADGEASSGETEARGLGRIPVHFAALPLRDAAGEVVGAVEYFMDFTEHRGALTSDREKLSRLCHSSGPALAVDGDLRVRFINEAGAWALGRSVDDCLGQKCRRLFRNPPCANVDCRSLQALQRNAVFSGLWVETGCLRLRLPVPGWATFIEEAGALLVEAFFKPQALVVRGRGPWPLTCYRPQEHRPGLFL